MEEYLEDEELWTLGNMNTFFCVCGTGAWTQGLHLEPLHQSLVIGFFEIGSQELLVQAVFEPW
jgi:hypothetical protein